MNKLFNVLKKNYFLIIAVLLIFLFFSLTFMSTNGIHFLGINTTTESITYDEMAHKASSYQYDHDMRMVLNPEHPILIKTLVGVPLNLININPTKFTYKTLISSNNDFQWDYANDLIFKNNPTRSDEIIFTARLSVLLINTSLLIIICFLAYKLFNKKVSLIMLSLLVFNPNVLAHASLVTFDVPSLLTTLLALLCFYGLLKNNNAKWAAYSGLAAGIASITKYSSVVLIVFIFIFYLVYSLIHLKNHDFMHKIRMLLIYSSTMMLVIVAVYLPFTYGIAKSDEHYQIYNIWYGHLSLFSKPLIDFLLSFSIPTKALAVWIDGLFITNMEVGINRSGVFLLGHSYDTGFLLQYFPIVFLTKNTIGELILFLTGIWLFIRLTFKKHADNFVEESFALIYAFIYFSLALYSKLKLGVRHLLPFEGTLSLFVAIIFNNNWTKKIFKIKVSTIFYVLIILSIISTITAYPHYLSYYNETVGGSYNAYNVAEDSNYDWGQDYITLKNWQDTNPDKQLYFDIFAAVGVREAYFGNDPSRFVVWYKNNLPSGSFIAVDSANITSAQSTRHFSYKQIFNKAPIRITPSIFIFEK